MIRLDGADEKNRANGPKSANLANLANLANPTNKLNKHPAKHSIPSANTSHDLFIFIILVLLACLQQLPQCVREGCGPPGLGKFFLALTLPIYTKLNAEVADKVVVSGFWLERTKAAHDLQELSSEPDPWKRCHYLLVLFHRHQTARQSRPEEIRHDPVMCNDHFRLLMLREGWGSMQSNGIPHQLSAVFIPLIGVIVLFKVRASKICTVDLESFVLGDESVILRPSKIMHDVRIDDQLQIYRVVALFWELASYESGKL